MRGSHDNDLEKDDKIIKKLQPRVIYIKQFKSKIILHKYL